MEYRYAYKIALEINDFFRLNFNGRKKAQLTQIILNNVSEAAQQSAKAGWRCAVCQSTNLESDSKCGYCDTPRPAANPAER